MKLLTKMVYCLYLENPYLNVGDIVDVGPKYSPYIRIVICAHVNNIQCKYTIMSIRKTKYKLINKIITVSVRLFAKMKLL